MIPFWKKTDKDSKPQSAQKRRQNTKPAVPRTAQQSIPMQRMFEDGTCRVKPNYYTRTIQYQDINYQLAQQEDKTAIFEEWCSFLNFFDSSIHFELSFVNTATDSVDFEKSIRIPYQQDGFDDVRAEYSQMLRQQLSKGNNGLTKTKFLTYGNRGRQHGTGQTPVGAHPERFAEQLPPAGCAGKAAERCPAAETHARYVQHGRRIQVPL